MRVRCKEIPELITNDSKIFCVKLYSRIRYEKNAYQRKIC